MGQNVRIIDGDGHIFEDMAGIVAHLPAAMRESAFVRLMGPFPQLDHLHHGSWMSPEGSFRNPGVQGWSQFIDRVGLERAVLYPTVALGYGRLTDPDLAIAACRAYNDWLSETYLRADPRLRALALIPMQDPPEAARELERAVVELGMCGAMLPPTGLPRLLGARDYWPVYEVADSLGCALAMHGGAHPDLGLNQQTVFAATHALGHPFAIAIACVDMIVNGVLDRFPRVRYGFMEGGVAWLLLVAERLPGSFSAFKPHDPGKRFLQAASGSEVARRIRDYLEAGRLYVGVEGDEPALAYAVSEFGAGPFVFSSDFPHEVNFESIRHEIDELLENEQLGAASKAAILADNAERFYRLSA